MVAVNRRPGDTNEEIDFVKRLALEAGAFAAEANEGFTKGGAGVADLASAVVEACEQPNTFHQLYQDDEPIQDKIEAVARHVYGARDVYYYPEAEAKITQFTREGLGHFPVCMAKTHLSLSSDPTLLNAPENFTLPVRDIRAYTGAGWLVPLCGDIVQMPGLGKTPAALNIDIDENGRTWDCDHRQTHEIPTIESAQANGNDLGPETGQGFRDYLDFNVEAEALGFTSSFLVEHHLTGWNQVSASLMLMIALAVRSDAASGSAVMVLPSRRDPVLLAEQAATLDLVSGGRFDSASARASAQRVQGLSGRAGEAEARFDETVEVVGGALTERTRFSPTVASGVSRMSWSIRRPRNGASAVSGRCRRAPPSIRAPRARLRCDADRGFAGTARSRRAHRALQTGAGSRTAWLVIECRSSSRASSHVANDETDSRPRLCVEPAYTKAHRRCVTPARWRRAAAPSARLCRKAGGTKADALFGTQTKSAPARSFAGRRRRLCPADHLRRPRAAAAVRTRDHCRLFALRPRPTPDDDTAPDGRDLKTPRFRRSRQTVQ